MFIPQSKPYFILSLFIFFVALFASSDVWSRQNAQQQKYQCKVISKSQAITNAKRRTKGKVVAANLVNKGKRSVYKVRILVDSKRVKTITIPACQ